jgi:serine protease Do
MTTRKSTFFYGVLIAFASIVGGMVLASRLDLTPRSLAGTIDVPVTNSAPFSGPVDATTFRTIAHDQGPSVVSIRVRSEREGRGIGELFSQQPFGRRGAPRAQPDQDAEPEIVQGAGSGFIVDKQGFILTNNHVVEDATEIEVKLMGMDDLSQWLPAKLVGRDALTDTALIQLTQLPDEALTVSKFGDSAQMAPGDFVMAIGNPFSLSNTVTVGVVSAVGRQTFIGNGRFEDFIQTDAAINRGNSGGPLLNIRGEVIGINTMILSDSQGQGNVGVGFAVPINTVRDILPQLRTGRVVRGRIAVSVSRVPLTKDLAEDYGLPSTAGAIIASVDEGGPAKAAGMRVRDVVVEFNGRPVRDNNELVSLVTRTAPDTTVPVKIIRNRKPMTLNVKVAPLNLAEEASTVAADTPRRPREVPRETRGFGMTFQALTAQQRGALRVPAGRGAAVIVDVTPFGAAQQGGLRSGDVVLSIQDKIVNSTDEVEAALDAIPAGRTASIVVWRIVDREAGEQLLLVRKR